MSNNNISYYSNMIFKILSLSIDFKYPKNIYLPSYILSITGLASIKYLPFRFETIIIIIIMKYNWRLITKDRTQ